MILRGGTSKLTHTKEKQQATEYTKEWREKTGLPLQVSKVPE